MKEFYIIIDLESKEVLYSTLAIALTFSTFEIAFEIASQMFDKIEYYQIIKVKIKI